MRPVRQADRTPKENAYVLLAEGVPPGKVEKRVKGITHASLYRWLKQMLQEGILRVASGGRKNRTFTRGPNAWVMDRRLGLTERWARSDGGVVAEPGFVTATELASGTAGRQWRGVEGIHDGGVERVHVEVERAVPPPSGRSVEPTRERETVREPGGVWAHHARYKEEFESGPTTEPPWEGAVWRTKGASHRHIFLRDGGGVVWRVQETRGDKGGKTLLCDLKGKNLRGFEAVMMAERVIFKEARDAIVEFARRYGYVLRVGKPVCQVSPVEYARDGPPTVPVGAPGRTRTWTDGSPGGGRWDRETREPVLMAEWERLPETRAIVEKGADDIAALTARMREVQALAVETAKVVETVTQTQAKMAVVQAQEQAREVRAATPPEANPPVGAPRVEYDPSYG